MYFNNLVRLSTHYLKNFISKDKDDLSAYIAISEDKNMPKHATNWMHIMSTTHTQSSKILQKNISIVSNILSTSLSIDAWYSEIEYDKVDNQKYIEYILRIIEVDKGISISTQIPLHEDNYHIIQTELFSFSKAFLSSIVGKKYVHNYSKEQLEYWMNL